VSTLRVACVRALLVFGAASDFNIYAVNASTGEQLWQFAATDEVDAPVTVDSLGNVYVGSDDNYLYSLFPNGTLRWRFNTGSGVYAAPALSPSCEVVFLASNAAAGSLYAIDAVTGELAWSVKLPHNERALATAVDAYGNVYVHVYSGSPNVLAYDVTGQLKYVRRTADVCCCECVRCSALLDAVGCRVGVDGATSDLTGALRGCWVGCSFRWSFNTSSELEAAPVLGSDGIVYVGAGDGNFYALSNTGAVQWSVNLGGRIR
jgi:outer membrane protein assembly factor BamB